MSKTIAENIKKLRKLYNLSQKDLADIAGVTDKAVSTWENGIKQPRMGAIQKIADHFGILKSSIIEENGLDTHLKLSNIKNQLINGVTLFEKKYNNTIKVYGKICAGDGKTAYEDIIDEIICPYPRIRGNLIALKVDGDSMNKVIRNGDYAIIKVQPTVENGQIAAVIIENEEAMLKRFYRLDNETVVLKPESTEDFKPIIFSKEQINKIKIIGKFIGYVSPYVE